jgi:hypothetical protein
MSCHPPGSGVGYGGDYRLAHLRQHVRAEPISQVLGQRGGERGRLRRPAGEYELIDVHG